MAQNDEARSGAGLGTFAGVFTPSVLTILGVIMYLRLGWVVGSVGVMATLAIVTLSTAITLITALSVAEIATDRVVRVGGAYYMISRALGIETGGAVGIPLFFAQALSVPLYTIGFAESLALTFPGLSLRWVAAAATVLVAGVALRSAEAAIKVQYVVMGAIGLSLVSLLAGSGLEGTRVELWRGAEGSPGFWVVFAVFFPAVTGIMAGVNMSGDLADPPRSIPRGTLAAIGVGYVVYMGLPILLAARADVGTLFEDPLVMRRMALWGPAILLGIWGATLSSAVGSILGAPRVLQALARDGVLPRPLKFLGKGSGPADEPRVGTVVTLAIALLAVALGDLDVIAPILTMFFLTTYLVLNLAAGIERLVDSPSFRPTFQVHWAISFLGAVGCFAVMLLVNAAATAVAAVVVSAVFVWLQRRELRTTWGDVRSGIWMSLLRSGLLRASANPDPKTWRPHLLVLSGSPTRRWPLIELASELAHNRALMTVASVITSQRLGGKRRRDLELTVRDFLQRRGVHALVRIVTAEDPYRGTRQLVEGYGLGRVVPNTVLMGLLVKDDSVEEYCDTLRAIHEGRRNLVLFSEGDGRGFGAHRRIDVWWGGLHSNGGLMLLLAYLLRTALRWRQARIHIHLMVDHPDAVEPARANLERIIGEMRIEARADVIEARGRSFPEVLAESSRETDLLFLGMADPGEDFADYYRAMRDRAARLPPTVHVLAAEDLEFGDVLLQD